MQIIMNILLFFVVVYSIEDIIADEGKKYKPIQMKNLSFIPNIYLKDILQKKIINFR